MRDERTPKDVYGEAKKVPFLLRTSKGPLSSSQYSAGSSDMSLRCKCDKSVMLKQRNVASISKNIILRPRGSQLGRKKRHDESFQARAQFARI